jgi:beta-lactamase class A
MGAYRESDAGRLDLDATACVRNEFTSAHDGSKYSLDRDEDSDDQPWQRLGQDVALRWLAYRAIVRSSNLATNLLLDAVGIEPVQRLLSDLGCARSPLVRGIEDDCAHEAGLHNLVTAADLAAQLQALWADANGSPSSPGILTAGSAREALDVLSAQQIADAIPRRLPPGAKVAHKSGWIDGVNHDAGIVFPPASAPFVFAMCTTAALPRDAAADVIAHAAAAAWQDVEAEAV